MAPGSKIDFMVYQLFWKSSTADEEI